MDTHLDFVATISINLPELIHKVKTGTLCRDINHSVAGVRLVLDKLVRTISLDYSVALLLIFAEVVLTR